MRGFVPRLRELAAVAVIGVFGTQLAVRVVRTLIDGGARPMYIDSWLFVVLMLGTALSVAGLVIGAIALAAMWLQRRPRRVVRSKPQVSGLVTKDGRPL